MKLATGTSGGFATVDTRFVMCIQKQCKLQDGTVEVCMRLYRLHLACTYKYRYVFKLQLAQLVEPLTPNKLKLVTVLVRVPKYAWILARIESNVQRLLAVLLLYF